MSEAPDSALTRNPDAGYWTAAIAAALKDTSRTSLLLELPPDQQPIPIVIDDDDTQTIASLIESKDPDCPAGIAQQLAQLALVKLSVDAIKPDLFSYLKMEDEGIGAMCMNLTSFCEEKPVFSAPADFDGNRHNIYKYTFAHGTDHSSAQMILDQDVIRPFNWTPSDPTNFPSFGFFGMGALGEVTEHRIRQLLKKLWKIPKGKQGVVLLGEVHTFKEHGTLNGGGVMDEQHAVRRKGIVKGSARRCFHSTYAQIKTLVMMRPI